MNRILKEILNDLFGNDDPTVVHTQNDNEPPKKPKRDKNSLKKALSRTVPIIVVVLLGLLILTNFYTVSEQENAVVTRGGKYYATKSAGAHFKMPFIDKVKFIDTKTQALEIGYRTESGETVEVEDESLMITSDFNFVIIDFFVEYKVVEAGKYAFSTTNPTEILRNAIQAEIRSTVAKYTVDEVLTTAKTEIQSQILENANKKAEEYSLGIYVEGVSIQDAEPPTTEVSNAFKSVESAKQNKETEINKANQYYNEEVPLARSDADKVIKAAESVKESRIAEATGQVARFSEMFQEYIKNPEITKTRLYYETMEEILPSMKVYIDNGEGVLKMLPLNE